MMFFRLMTLNTVCMLSYSKLKLISLELSWFLILWVSSRYLKKKCPNNSDYQSPKKNKKKVVYFSYLVISVKNMCHWLFFYTHIESINIFCWLYFNNIVRITPVKHLNVKTTMSEMKNIQAGINSTLEI